MSKRGLKLYGALTVVSLKMYFRNKNARFFALFFPMVIMLIFGMLNFDRFTPPEVGITDNASNTASRQLIDLLRGGDAEVLSIEIGDRRDLEKEFRTGGIDALLLIPEGFGAEEQPSTIEATYDDRKPQERGVVATVLEQSLEELFVNIADVPPEYQLQTRFEVSQTNAEGQGEGFRGFLVPGIAAMSIMQTGVFGVVFSLVRFKVQGVLRRLKATPIGASHFLVGQIATRLIVTVLQTYVIVGVGMIVLGVTIGPGNPIAWLDLTLVSLIGGALFISIGLAISGWAKNEDTAAPVANIITLPMMFLSGVFFPPSILPDWLNGVAQVLPLTYLADGMRAITVDGAHVTDLGKEMLGLAAWSAVFFVIATRSFKWE